MMTTMKYLFLLALLPAMVRAESTSEWIERQWAKIPAYEQAERPSAAVPINDEDRANLDLETDPVARNAYITASYHVIAQELSRCLNMPDIANWYHYGNWASRNSGRYISQEHFRQMHVIHRWGLDLGGRLRLIPTQEEMVSYLVHTNFLIAVEMIPLGRHFINSFCGEGPTPTYEEFAQVLTTKQAALNAAFAHYLTAKDTKRDTLREERVVYATTLHMFAEQTRAQNNVDMIFRLGDEHRGPIEFFYRWIAAGATGMELDNGFVIPFARDVDAREMKPALQTLMIASYRELFMNAGLALDPVRGVFRGSAVKDWGNLRQRLRFLAAIARAHAGRIELLTTYP